MRTGSRETDAWDSREHRLRAEFDELRRPTEQWLQTDYTQSTQEILVGKTIYGESATSPEVSNLRGKAWKSYDQSGLTESVSYDFKGNLLQGVRQLTIAYNTPIDWNIADPATLLQTETFTTITAYDALNRATSIHTPHNAGIPANEVLPEYNDASLLDSVKVKQYGSTSATTYVSNIDYNAKGQRERIQYGNGAVTRCEYDPDTFRLIRLWAVWRNGVSPGSELHLRPRGKHHRDHGRCPARRVLQRQRSEPESDIPV